MREERIVRGEVHRSARVAQNRPLLLRGLGLLVHEGDQNRGRGRHDLAKSPVNVILLLALQQYVTFFLTSKTAAAGGGETVRSFFPDYKNQAGRFRRRSSIDTYPSLSIYLQRL